MLIDAIKQHGKKQIEVKQKIRITDKTKKLKYRVDTFFIFPGALQITEYNFKKEEFKHNLKCYLSLSEQSPSLDGLLKELVARRISSGKEEKFDDFFKRFCLKYKTALQESSRSLMEKQELSAEETETFLQTVYKLLDEFRNIKFSQENSEREVRLLDKLDEYLTVVTAFCLKDLNEVCIGEPRNKILSFWQEVEKYRASRFPVKSIEGESKESAFLMRWSFLKKFVQTALAHVESTRQILHTDFFQKMLIQIADDLIGLIGFNLNKFVGIFQGIVNDFYQKTGGCTTGIGFRKLPIRSIFPVKGFKFFLKITQLIGSMKKMRCVNIENRFLKGRKLAFQIGNIRFFQPYSDKIIIVCNEITGSKVVWNIRWNNQNITICNKMPFLADAEQKISAFTKADLIKSAFDHGKIFHQISDRKSVV